MAKEGFKLPTPEEMRTFLSSPEYRQAVSEARARMDDDDAVREEADWFGTTGLSEEDEREIPRYLRREFGESLSEDPNALKAADLLYLGAFDEHDGRVRYWGIPSSSTKQVYAYVIQQADSLMTGWGNREPPSSGA